MFQIFLALGVFDMKILTNYGEHHLVLLCSYTSSIYVVIMIILLIILWNLDYKMIVLIAQTNQQIDDHQYSSSRKVLEHKKLTMECKLFKCK